MKGFPGFSLYFLPNKVKDKDVLLGNLVTSIMRMSRTEYKKKHLALMSKTVALHFPHTFLLHISFLISL